MTFDLIRSQRQRLQPENMSKTSETLYNPDKLYSPGYVRDLLSYHDIRLKKNLGQNFMIDRHGVDKIMKAADISSNDIVLEVGPGIGNLTYQLVQKAKQVISLEIDDRFMPVLKGLFGGFDNLTLVHADILKVDLKKRFDELGFFPNKIVANVPYYITTPILTTLVKSGIRFDSATFTMQKEVAERYIAKPGTKAYGSISVVINYWGKAKLCSTLPARCFFPQPKIESSVMTIEMHPTPPIGVANEQLFYKIVRAAFSKRRKMLRNSLDTIENAGYAVKKAFITANIDETRRAESLSLDDFARLTDAIIVETGKFAPK